MRFFPSFPLVSFPLVALVPGALLFGGCSEDVAPPRGGAAVVSNVDEDGVAYSDEDGVDYAKDATSVSGDSDGDPDDMTAVDEGGGDGDIDGPDLPGSDLDLDPAAPFVEDTSVPDPPSAGVSPQALGLHLASGDHDSLSTSISALSGDLGGVNGASCLVSPYNCRLRSSGGNRVKKDDSNPDRTFSNVSWLIGQDGDLRDGNGTVVGTQKAGSHLKFNFGLRRKFDVGGGVLKTHGLALTTSAHSAAWFPLDKVHAGATLAKKLGSVTTHRAGLAELHCYEIRSDIDPVLASKKVVRQTLAASGPVGEAAGDYLPKYRNDIVVDGKSTKRISVNMLFGVPGVGGVSNDHFPEGTKFRRLEASRFGGGPPSVSVELWTEADGVPQPNLLTKEINGIADRALRKKKLAELRASSKFTKRWKKDLKFVYGYVVAADRAVRTGWIALEALKPSEGCPSK